MPDRPEVPSEVDREVRIQCGHRCAVCGEGAGLEIAHIRPYCECRDHAPENLILLCASCHARADQEKWGEETLREYREKPWFLRREWDTPPNSCKIEVTFSIELTDKHTTDLDTLLQSTDRVKTFFQSAVKGFASGRLPEEFSRDSHGDVDH